MKNSDLFLVAGLGIVGYVLYKNGAFNGLTGASTTSAPVNLPEDTGNFPDTFGSGSTTTVPTQPTNSSGQTNPTGAGGNGANNNPAAVNPGGDTANGDPGDDPTDSTGLTDSADYDSGDDGDYA